ncbi:hypothetical protein Tsubulata_048032, partial [Turnera subulata]
EKLGPGVVGEDVRGELGDGAAKLVGDGFGLIVLDGGEEGGFGGGLGGGGEVGPEVGVVVAAGLHKAGPLEGTPRLVARPAGGKVGRIDAEFRGLRALGRGRQRRRGLRRRVSVRELILLSYGGGDDGGRGIYKVVQTGLKVGVSPSEKIKASQLDGPIVDMKEKNTSSVLRRILANCGAQAKEYGSCVAARVPEIERDMCLKEFLTLNNCMKSVVRGKF